MYLFLGGDFSVLEDSIIGIFDMDNTTVSAATRKFLKRAQQEGSVINVSFDLPKSFCLAEENGREKVYVSQVSPNTLKKRVGEL